MAFCLLPVWPPGVARATLTYENINGTGLVYDSVEGIFWTQEANLSGATYDFSDAQSWAANLEYAGIAPGNWQLPDGAQFTSLYNQLDGTGDKYGAEAAFGAGPNDYVSDVAPEYWTSADATDFNFSYGYPGSKPDSNVYPVWAVTTVPEPGAMSLGVLAGLVFIAARVRRGGMGQRGE